MSNQSKHFLNSSSDEPTTNQDDSQAAANLARAKLQSLYGPDKGATTAPSTPVSPTEASAAPRPPSTFETFTIPRGQAAQKSAPSTPQTLYAREQHLQAKFEPSVPHAAPDHELSAPSGEFQLPMHTKSASSQTTTATPTAPQTLEELNRKASTVHPSSVDRESAIKQFAEQARNLKQPVQDKFAFWKRKRRHASSSQHHKKSPFFRTALITALVLALYNQQVISGQINYYISPGDAIVSPQIIDPTTSNDVPDEPLVIIPKINVEVPTVYGVETRDDSVIQESLEDGVVHYARTAVPGQVGNTVIMGHSSNSFWNGGRHKNAFSLLDRLEIGDTYMIHYKGKRYVYEVFNKEVIEPTEFRVVSQETNGVPISTLITCTPPGTSWKRLVIQAEQISPNPAEAKAAEIVDEAEEQEILAGNTDSLWDNVRQWLFE